MTIRKYLSEANVTTFTIYTDFIDLGLTAEETIVLSALISMEDARSDWYVLDINTRLSSLTKMKRKDLIVVLNSLEQKGWIQLRELRLRTMVKIVFDKCIEELTSHKL